jgi:DNA-binding response OmpR family regulator
MDRAAHRVRRAGKEVHLGPTEYKLLDHLIQHPGRVFSREQLLDAVWGSDVYVEARTVDVHVGRLRKALNIEGAPSPIRIRTAGYSLGRAIRWTRSAYRWCWPILARSRRPCATGCPRCRTSSSPN